MSQKLECHFSKPRRKFLGDMLYGIQDSGDTQLSSIMRAINDDPDMKHAVEKRLSRNMVSIDLATAYFASASNAPSRGSENGAAGPSTPNPGQPGTS